LDMKCPQWSSAQRWGFWKVTESEGLGLTGGVVQWWSPNLMTLGGDGNFRRWDCFLLPPGEPHAHTMTRSLTSGPKPCSQLTLDESLWNHDPKKPFLLSLISLK
jgi:hypothetical protein